MYTGFEPLFDKNSRVLILGIFPSVKSRQIDFYYGNPQNKFWKMLEQVFGESIGNNTEEKKKFLLNKKMALWDIVKACEIKGSMDSDLKCLEVVDLTRIMTAASIEKIICNGTKAYQIFCDSYPSLIKNCVCLPSTSPANVRFKLELWGNELKCLQ